MHFITDNGRGPVSVRPVGEAFGAMDELLDLATAAARCGTTSKALARRIERGTLKAQKDTRTGRRLVTVEALRDAGMDPDGAPQPQQGSVTDVTVSSDLLDRLERQAAQLAQLRLLTEQAESQQRQEQEKIAELKALLEAKTQEAEALRSKLPWWRRKSV